MLGSSLSIAGPNVVLNTAVAESLRQFYEALQDVSSDKMEEAVHTLVKDTLKTHKKIIFNGNGYSEEWVKEAAKRGLPNLKSTPEALPCFIDQKNKDLFILHHIFTETEITSRYEILLENYSKTLHIEAKTLSDMIRRDFLPALLAYADKVACTVADRKNVVNLSCTRELALITKLSEGYEKISVLEEKLENDTAAAESMTDPLAASKFYHETILADMDAVRSLADAMEVLLPADALPYPSYSEILFYV